MLLNTYKTKIAKIAHILHWLFFLTMMTSVFWLEWYYVAIIFLLLRIQDFFWGGRVLTYLQYGSFKRQWVFYDLIQKSGLPKWFYTLLFDWLFPALLVFLAFILN